MPRPGRATPRYYSSVIGSPRARALLAASPAIDLHADTLMWVNWFGYDLLGRHVPPLPKAAFVGHVDVPRMIEGGMGAQFFGLVSLPVTARARGPLRAVHEQIDALDEAIARRPEKLRKVRTAEEIEASVEAGSVGALLGIEGAHALEGELDNLDALVRRGVRYLGLLHFSANLAGHPAYGRGRSDSEGLSPWGRALVHRCEERGVLIDLAHINRRGFLEACAQAKKPPIVSHTGASGAFAHWRNVDDDQLRAVARIGGCVGVMFCPEYVGGQGLGPVVKHLRHIVDVAGEDTPALGSDWDGFIVPTKGLSDPLGLPLLVDALLAEGMPERVVRKIVRQNVMRVLRA
jgi:membrane dipeptidase